GYDPALPATTAVMLQPLACVLYAVEQLGDVRGRTVAVVGQGPLARTEAIKKLWDYIKAQGLQDPKDKRSIRADDRLRAVFGKDRIGMFEIAGLIGKHLG
ncbi:MAG: SWIB/MDM2 domain-containing protein, partial [Hylemonella sp.]